MERSELRADDRSTWSARHAKGIPTVAPVYADSGCSASLRPPLSVVLRLRAGSVSRR
ncbi:hypothetical protein Rhow_008623 [Rhodococcus wratislaviensis]|uniref:Uncharacterized protein n=1 Tax=Rhodococcus wratislaviensis TaxID=44752 RepID=A0A402C1J1_RHOWR|nr:hypothetical protein Rhow_008623 [Rhodococcus wratislaviensis]